MAEDPAPLDVADERLALAGVRAYFLGNAHG